MSVLSSKDGVKARKNKRCTLCGELISVGELKDVRSGVDFGDFWTMHMHPECHKYEEKRPSPVEWEWYEDSGGEPAFDRKDAITFRDHPF